MRNTRLLFTVSVLLLLCLASVALAQDNAVTLRLKFAANDMARYRFYGEVTGGMQMQGLPLPQGQNGTMPLQATITAELFTKVLGVDPTGVASMALRMDKADMAMNIMGKPLKATLANGQLKMTGPDGQAQALPLTQAFQGKPVPLLQTPVTLKINSRGQVLDLQMPGLPAGMPNMPGMDMKTMLAQSQVALPEGPLTIGQAWTDHRVIPMGGANMTDDTTYTLAGLETKNGKQLARINVESTGGVQNANLAEMMKASGQQLPAGTPMPAGTMSLQVKLSGVMLFNVTDGHLSRMDFTMNEAMSNTTSMTVPNQPPMNFSTNMNINIKGAVAGI